MRIIEDGYGGDHDPEPSIDELADKAWQVYAPPIDVREKLDELTDDQFFLCGDMYAEGFKAGIAWVLTNGKPQDD